MERWWDFDTCPCQETLNECPLRYDSNQLCAFPEISSLDSVERRMSWFTVSKAADKSSQIRTDDWAEAFATLNASVTDKRAVSVEWPLLKPDCLGSSKLFWDRKSETCLKTTFSRIFDKKARRETGQVFSSHRYLFLFSSVDTRDAILLDLTGAAYPPPSVLVCC